MSRTIIVTGASRGIGGQLALDLSERGHRVIATCRHPSTSTLVDELPLLPLDATDSASCEALAAHLAESIDYVDVLVNNAGIKAVPGFDWEASAGPLERIEPDAVATVLHTNVIGALNVTRALLPLLGTGSVVANISSQLGSLADGVDVDYAYNASKSALNMVTVTMQRDLGPRGIAAVAINPGWVKTSMGGAGAPLETADAVADLADLVSRLDGTFGGRFVDRYGETTRW